VLYGRHCKDEAMSVKLIWREMPKEVRRIVEPLVKKHLHLLPPWCIQLSIKYGETKDDIERAVAYIEVEPQYLQARLTICRLYLEQDDYNRESTIVHELLHVAIAPIQSFMEHLMKIYVAEESEVATWRDNFNTEVIEGVVQSLMHSLSPRVSS
jgi:hypothetical protein